MYKHEDDRRSLIEWGTEGGPWRVAKVVEAKCDCKVGDHLHRAKDEHFLLLRGRLVAKIAGADYEYQEFEAPAEIAVPRDTMHTFWLDEGSILLGLASEPFDPADDHKA